MKLKITNLKSVALIAAITTVVLIGINFLIPAKTNSDPIIRKIQEKGKLVIGTDAPYGIMEFLDKEGKVIGVDADIGAEIGKSLGVKVEMVDYDWDKLLEAVKNGEVDIAVSSITITPDRESEMLFSIPYFNGGQSILVNIKNNNINLPEDLKNKRIGVQKQSTSEIVAKKYTSEKNISLFDSYDVPKGTKSGIIYDLLTGKLDAAMWDYIACLSIVKDNPGIKIVGEPITQEYYGVVTKLGNNLLMERINSVLRDLKNSGKLQEIINRWK
jgi:ABC-type amino acid transport substrate-binding protein